MKLKANHIAAAVVGVFVIGIGGASLLGFWKTTNTKQPVAIKTGEFAGMPNPSDIRGSYTWNDVAKAFGFDVKLALEAFGAKDAAEKVNTLETIYGGAGLPEGLEIGTDSVRLFVSLLTGLPHSPEASTVLPATAIPVLKASGKADPAAIDAAAAKAFSPKTAETQAPAPAPAVSAPAVSPAPAAAPATAPASAAKPTAPSAAPSAAPAPAPAPAAAQSPVPAPAPKSTASSETSADHTPVAGSVTGKTTFKDLKTWGLSEEKIRSATGGTIGPDSAVIKDWASANGLTFSELKTELQKLLDAK